MPSRPVDGVGFSFAADGFVIVLAVTSSPCAIRLHAHNGLERGQTFFFPLFVHFLAVVQKVFDTVHVAVVRQCDSIHARFDTFVHYLFHFGQAVQQGIVGVHMQMCECHIYSVSFVSVTGTCSRIGCCCAD